MVCVHRCGMDQVPAVFLRVGCPDVARLIDIVSERPGWCGRCREALLLDLKFAWHPSTGILSVVDGLVAD